MRITGSGTGGGDDWLLWNGRLIPPLDDLGTVLEYGHRLLATALSLLPASEPATFGASIR